MQCFFFISIKREFRNNRAITVRSNPMLVQMVDDLWIENSISCTDGYNGRNMFNITKWSFLEIHVYMIESNKVTTNE